MGRGSGLWVTFVSIHALMWMLLPPPLLLVESPRERTLHFEIPRLMKPVLILAFAVMAVRIYRWIHLRSPFQKSVL